MTPLSKQKNNKKTNGYSVYIHFLIYRIMNKKNEKKPVEAKGMKKEAQAKECKCSTSEKKSVKK
ncbi:MAG: hypothetical protein J6K31_02275 [Parabacteroides sp.]|nr:hypothetical protein [Parabacteroides sp.]